MADHPDIERAVLQAQAGPDRDSGFRRLYETYFRAVRGFYVQRAFSRADAEELTQETFLRVYRSLGDYGHRGHFGAWLFTIAENVAHKEWEKRRTKKRHGTEVSYDEAGPADEGEGAPPAPAQPAHQVDDAYRRERRQILGEALAGLAERQRQCLAIRVRGHSYQEIATLLRIAPETVKRHLGEAKKSLRRRLADLDLGPLDEGS